MALTVETPAPATGRRLEHREVLVVFSGLMLGMFLASLDNTIVATALPTITGDLGGLNHLSWVVTAYLLASTISSLLCGRLGDLFGRKRMFQLAIVVFLVGSALCGFAQSMAQLITFRAVQGLGGGGLMVMAQAIIAEVVSPRERGRYQGYFSAMFSVSSVGGPLLGGFITDEASWRWVFYVNLPLGLVALVVTAARLPPSPPAPRVRIDYLGAALLASAVSCVVLVTTWGGSEYDWGSAVIVGLGAAGLLLAVLLVVVERRTAQPIVPVHLFRIGTYRIATAISFIVGLAMLSVATFIPLFLQVVKGVSATSSGLLLFPMMLGLLGASMTAGRLITRTGRYRYLPIGGTALCAVALFLLSTMGTSTSRPTVTAYMVVTGIGIGMTMLTMVLAVQNAVSAADLGVATSGVTFARSMGGAVGVAVCGAIFNHVLRGHAGATLGLGEASGFTPQMIDDLPASDRVLFVSGVADGLTTVFLVVAPLVAAAFVLSTRLKEIPLRSGLHDADLGAESPTTASLH